MTENIAPPQRALRYNRMKPLMSLITPIGLIELAKVYTYGAKKYEPHNWQRGMPWSECADSLMRHLMCWLDGEDRDEESGLLHMAHVAWNALTLVHYAVVGRGTDDRFTDKARFQIKASAVMQQQGKHDESIST